MGIRDERFWKTIEAGITAIAAVAFQMIAGYWTGLMLGRMMGV